MTPWNEHHWEENAMRGTNDEMFVLNIAIKFMTNGSECKTGKLQNIPYFLLVISTIKYLHHKYVPMF